MNSIPKIDSIQNLAEFWDTHDLADFENELIEVTEQIFIKDTVMKIRLSSEEAKTITNIANLQGIEVTDLIHKWITENSNMWFKLNAHGR